MASLEDFPESIEDKKDGKTNISGQKIGGAPILVVFASEDVEAIEEDDDGEEHQ